MTAVDAKRFWNIARIGVAQLFLDRRCRLCNQHEAASAITQCVCEECAAKLAAMTARVCQTCAAPVGPHLPTDDCIECRPRRLKITRTVSCGLYRDELRTAILKAKRVSGIAEAIFLGRLLARRLADLSEQRFDFVIPVPTHWTARLLHGYHSADAIAESVAAETRLTFEPNLLRKTRRTEKQALLSATARPQNVRNAFAARHSLTGANILLVDDVMTTGATASACVQALNKADAEQVTVAVIARKVSQQ